MQIYMSKQCQTFIKSLIGLSLTTVQHYFTLYLLKFVNQNTLQQYTHIITMVSTMPTNIYSALQSHFQSTLLELPPCFTSGWILHVARKGNQGSRYHIDCLYRRIQQRLHLQQPPVQQRRRLQQPSCSTTSWATTAAAFSNVGNYSRCVQQRRQLQPPRSAMLATTKAAGFNSCRHL